MSAANVLLEIEQGAEFQFVVTLVGGPSSLAGYTGAMQIRPMRSSVEVLYEVPGSGITIDPDNRQVVVRLDHLATAEFDWNDGTYDILITSGDEADAYRVAEGKVKVDHWVTREGA